MYGNRINISLILQYQHFTIHDQLHPTLLHPPYSSPIRHHTRPPPHPIKLPMPQPPLEVLHDSLERKIKTPLYKSPDIPHLASTKSPNTLPPALSALHRRAYQHVPVAPLPVLDASVCPRNQQLEPPVIVLIACVEEVLNHDRRCVGDARREDFTSPPGPYSRAPEQT
jgi:hypothetical protein